MFSILLNKLNFLDKIDLSYKWMFFSIGILIVALNCTIQNNIYQCGWMDPFFYTAYIHNYSTLIDMHGRTYYSCRIAFIYPARLMAWVFGSELGYIVLRNIFLSGALIAVWRITQHFYKSILVSVFISSFVIFNPWFLRTLFWDYTDGAAIVYALLSISFYMIKENKFSYFISGVFFLLSINCNPFSIIILAAFIFSWFIISNIKSNLKFRYIDLGFFFFGILSTELFLIGITYLEFPNMNPFFDLAVFEIVNSLIHTPAAKMSSFPEMITQGKYEVLLPFFVSFLGLVYWTFTKKNNKERFGLLSIIAICMSLFFYYIAYIVCSQNFFGCLFYFSYLFIPVLFVLIFLIGDSISSLCSNDQNKILFPAIILYLCLWINMDYIKSLGVFSGISFLVFSILFIIFFLLALIRNQTIAKPVFVIIFVVMSVFVFYNNRLWGHYDFIHDHKRYKLERDVYLGSIQIQKSIVNAIDLRKSTIGIWHSIPSGHRYLNGFQHMFLGIPNRMFKFEGNGMPVVDDYFRIKLVEKDFIALLGINENEIEEGYKALCDEGIQTSIVLRSKYRSKYAPCHLLLLKIERS